MGRKRAKYSEEIKEKVKQRYPHCKNLDEKRELAKELGMGSLHKLYNLASRLGVTRTHSDDDMNIGIDNFHVETIRAKLSDTVFADLDDQYLKNHFGNTKMQTIAHQRGYSEPALLWRARKLGLRQPTPFWRVSQVESWLGLSEGELAKEPGIIVMKTPVSDEGQHLLVSATTLAGWCKQNEMRLQGLGADEFFILELQEALQTIINLESDWEVCKYLSADHLCQNPVSTSYGLYCTKRLILQPGEEEPKVQRAGDDPKCGNVKLLPLLRV